jgi:hypothetical protein
MVSFTKQTQSSAVDWAIYSGMVPYLLSRGSDLHVQDDVLHLAIP